MALVCPVHGHHVLSHQVSVQEFHSPGPGRFRRILLSARYGATGGACAEDDGVVFHVRPLIALCLLCGKGSGPGICWRHFGAAMGLACWLEHLSCRLAKNPFLRSLGTGEEFSSGMVCCAQLSKPSGAS